MILQSKLGMVDVTTKVIDYLDNDGDLFLNHPIKEILITDESDLDELVSYPIGSIAYTADLLHIYMLNSESEWVEVGTENIVNENNDET